MEIDLLNSVHYTDVLFRATPWIQETNPGDAYPKDPIGNHSLPIMENGKFRYVYVCYAWTCLTCNGIEIISEHEQLYDHVCKGERNGLGK